MTAKVQRQSNPATLLFLEMFSKVYSGRVKKLFVNSSNFSSYSPIASKQTILHLIFPGFCNHLSIELTLSSLPSPSRHMTARHTCTTSPLPRTICDSSLSCPTPIFLINSTEFLYSNSILLSCILLFFRIGLGYAFLRKKASYYC